MEPHIGAQVIVKNIGRGIVRFIGETSFKEGTWVGVELGDPVGKNDGSVKGQRYFTCRPLYGVFVTPRQIEIINASGPPSRTNGTSPALVRGI